MEAGQIWHLSSQTAVLLWADVLDVFDFPSVVSAEWNPVNKVHHSTGNCRQTDHRLIFDDWEIVSDNWPHLAWVMRKCINISIFWGSCTTSQFTTWTKLTFSKWLNYVRFSEIYWPWHTVITHRVCRGPGNNSCFMLLFYFHVSASWLHHMTYNKLLRIAFHLHLLNRVKMFNVAFIGL